MKTGTWLAIVLLTLVTLAHAARIVLGLPVVVGTFDVPIAVSVFGVVVPGSVAALLWRDARGTAARGIQ